MDADELPSSRLVGATASQTKLGKLLEGLIGGGSEDVFTAYELIEGDVRGGRILYPSTLPPSSATEFPTPISATAMAGELINHWRGETLYPTPAPKNKECGWEIRVTNINGKAALICWAAYCTRVGYKPKRDA